jgi:hypothetical protein
MVVVHCQNNDNKNYDLWLFVKDLRTSNRCEQRIGFILIQKELVEFFTNEDFRKSGFIFNIQIILKSIYRLPATFW